MKTRHPGTMVAGFVFMLLGAMYMLEAFDVWEIKLRIWPIILVAIGVVILLGGRMDRDESRPDDEGN